MDLLPDALLEPLLRGPAAHILAGVLGALFGSFANVCIVRWPPTDEHPEGRSVVRPGSRCPACGAAIRWYDNFPLLSYLLLRGRCRACAAAFSPRYLLVEGVTALLFAAAYHLEVVLLHPAAAPELRLLRFAITAAFLFVLVVITFIDLDHKLILNKITYPAIPIFYGLGMLLPERSWQDGLIGAAVGYGVVRLVADGYYLLTRRRGLGYGDGKLLAVIGAYIGWQAVVVSLFLGSILGTIIGGTVLIAQRLRAEPSEPSSAEGGAPQESLRHVEIPFGPFLAAAAVLYLFLEPTIRLRYLFLYH
jgi:leader peptidase (prepilin peptidase)/N-methyltransferase